VVYLTNLRNKGESLEEMRFKQGQLDSLFFIKMLKENTLESMKQPNGSKENTHFVTGMQVVPGKGKPETFV